MSFDNYKDAINWLFLQFPSYQQLGSKAYKPDLGNISELLSALGYPHQSLKFIHVAGTNGKGSVCSMLASILKESEYKTGLFTSPHISDFRERIRVNGEMIPEAEVIRFCNTIRDNQELSALQPSFFEITFAMAIQYFQIEKCDICVIETGLGGRLDATNIITPELSIITNISFDHTDLLGNTIAAIAKEKAGIIKANIPVIIGEHNEETFPVFKAKSKVLDSPLIFSSDSETEIYKLPFLADYQKQNFRIALTAVKELVKIGYSIDPKKIQLGINHLNSNTGFIGRMQLIQESPKVIVDVSHNIAGVEKTLDTILKIKKGSSHIIFGASSDKDHASITRLFPEKCILSFCLFSNPRGWNRTCAQKVAEGIPSEVLIFDDVHEALSYHKSIANQEDTILILGSFFLLSDFFSK
jgi:dihydrofolate synthase/folylpolyglutamate synthase